MAKVERLNVLNKANPQVHPAADVFPMMDDEALQDLAQDIKANGLLVPVVVDKDGTLIDGRNRFKACQMAGVEPTFQTFEGDDPVAYIIGINVARRHLSKGQQAMSVAKIYPEPDKGGRGKVKNLKETLGFSTMRLSQARTVLRFAPELVDLVLDGSKGLDEAYKKACERKEQEQLTASRMKTLRQQAPDLADAVEEECMTLDQAYAEVDRRMQEDLRKHELARTQRINSTEQMQKLITGLYLAHDKEGVRQRIDQWMEMIDPAYWDDPTPLNRQTVDLCIEALLAIRDRLPE
jgi:hypothetical protein